MNSDYTKLVKDLRLLYFTTVVQELNDEQTRRSLRILFLEHCYSSPGITSAQIQCDKSNNPPSVVEAKDLAIRVKVQWSAGDQTMIYMSVYKVSVFHNLKEVPNGLNPE